MTSRKRLAIFIFKRTLLGLARTVAAIASILGRCSNVVMFACRGWKLFTPMNGNNNLYNEKESTRLKTKTSYLAKNSKVVVENLY